MLQHSRTAPGVKEFADINALTEEYLRLSYHGLRAKEKAFNADLQIELDQTTGLISIIPQEIGRVLLNLFNNAFYAVLNKSKTSSESYKPLVSLKTTRHDKVVEIAVSDNGGGISPDIIDKIFQPFFTTKSAGEGTGLGLSLSYDIVKAHGGEIKVKNNDDGGATFSVSLPVA